jgi:hypothetical protein
MNRDDFFALPPTIALRVLFDCLDENTVKALARKEAPVAPRSPKFDYTIYRRDGLMFASECSLETLRYWHKRAAESAAGGGEYAAKDAKNAENLARWISWREWYPEAVWSGERNRDPVVALPPSDKPNVYPRTGGNRPPPPPADEFGGANDTDNIPF